MKTNPQKYPRNLASMNSSENTFSLSLFIESADYEQQEVEVQVFIGDLRTTSSLRSNIDYLDFGQFLVDIDPTVVVLGKEFEQFLDLDSDVAEILHQLGYVPEVHKLTGALTFLPPTPIAGYVVTEDYHSSEMEVEYAINSYGGIYNSLEAAKGSVELENPYDSDVNDFEGSEWTQKDDNHFLVSLTEKNRFYQIRPVMYGDQKI